MSKFIKRKAIKMTKVPNGWDIHFDDGESIHLPSTWQFSKKTRDEWKDFLGLYDIDADSMEEVLDFMGTQHFF